MEIRLSNNNRLRVAWHDERSLSVQLWAPQWQSDGHGFGFISEAILADEDLRQFLDAIHHHRMKREDTQCADSTRSPL
jgi:hypothetical protein